MIVSNVSVSVIMKGDGMKKQDIFDQVLSWMINLNLNGAKTFTDKGQFSQEIAAVKKKQVCRCHPYLGG